MWNVKIQQTSEYNKSRLTDKENKPTVSYQWGAGRGRGNKQVGELEEQPIR